jgi:hypothetical protein
VEKTNLISKFKRRDLNVNTDRRIRRGPAWCSRKDKEYNFSFWKVSEHLIVTFPIRVYTCSYL